MKKSVLLAATLSLFAGSVRAQTNLNSGLLGHFPFNGNMNDVTGNLTTQGGTNVFYAADARGNANAALRLSGSGEVRIDPLGLLDFGTTGSFSFAVAFRTLSSGTQSFFTNLGYSTAAGPNAAGSRGWALGFDNGQVGKVYMSLLRQIAGTNPGSNPGSASLGLATLATYNDGQWHTAVTTVDRTARQVRIYVDGVTQALTYVSTNPTYGRVTGSVFEYDMQLAAIMNLNPGYSPGFVGSYIVLNRFGADFNGSLDEARFYNRVLTITEVQALTAQVLASAKQAAARRAVALFPNPAAGGVVHLRTAAPVQPAQVRVYTTAGQPVHPAITRVSPQEMRLQGLAPGLYLVATEVEGQLLTQKLVVE